MSLTSGLQSPRTPLRRFLDRELSAGPRRVRATYRVRLPHTGVLLPGEGVGFEAGTVGTAIDQRLRLAFTTTAPLDEATVAGIASCQLAARASRRRGRSDPVWSALAAVGAQLADAVATQVGELGLAVRERPMLRSDEEEEHLARLLLCAAWYALNYRNPFAFPDTPMVQSVMDAPRGFTLRRLLAVPTRALVDDVLAQLHAAEDGPLDDLRRDSLASACVGGPTFDGSTDVKADADLIADGLLLDFKSTRTVSAFPQSTVLQLLGYVLLDYSDRYRIDAVGVYLTRAAALISWPVEQYLALLGARRRDLIELRALFAELLGQPGWHADEDPRADRLPDIERMLAKLAPVIPDGCCRVCAQPLSAAALAGGRRAYCSHYCGTRAKTLRSHGWL